MKSEHRHELKTNELAQWLSDLPQWSKDNLGTIIIVIAAIVFVAGFFGWKSISQNVRTGEHEEFTNMIEGISLTKTEIASQQSASQISNIVTLGRQADDMEDFARKRTQNKNMAALALVKAADAIRSELQYRDETLSQKDIIAKITEAKKDYSDAIAKSPSNNTIMALAAFGLGLCAEDIGDFNEASKIYNNILKDDRFAGTVVVNKAKLRLNTMDDYKQEIVFLPAPPKPAPDPNSLDSLVKMLRDEGSKKADANSPSNSDANSAGTAINSVLPIEPNISALNNAPNDVNKPK